MIYLFGHYLMDVCFPHELAGSLGQGVPFLSPTVTPTPHSLHSSKLASAQRVFIK